MSDTAIETLSVVIEREISYPPERIWRALTQPHLIAEPPSVVTYSPLIPLFMLLFSGLYMFVLPYTARRRAIAQE